MLNFFFFFLLLGASVHSLDPTLNDDVLGLIVFKAGLQDPHSKLLSWNEDDPTPCNWVGVQCHPVTRRVTRLLLDGFSLSGHISHGLLRLQSLRILSLSSNNFTGGINPDLPRLLPGLKLVDFSDNSLSAEIPHGFFSQQCSSLRFVSFARNHLTGQIPTSLTSCAALSTLDLSSNRISGELPSDFWSLTGVTTLDLSDNLLEGQIPPGISKLSHLKSVSLRNNRFSGQLPVDIGSCPGVQEIDFSDNFLTGAVPETLRKVKSCVSLRLGGNSLTGEVPHWIGELASLETLDLSANNLSGLIPISIGRLTLLKHLNLSMNHLTGSPLQSFLVALENLEVLDLSSNSLSDEIPAEFGALGRLLVVNVSSNQLNGVIPSSIGQLKMAKLIDFSGNKLNGSIPPEIGEAVSLVSLSLENNLLTGDIPTHIAKCSSLTSLILSKNKLAGLIPAAIGDLRSLQLVDLSFNNLSGSLPKELTNLSNLSAFNISHNNLQGELPVGTFFNAIPPSSVSDNPSLCGSVVKRPCPSIHLKPIVLDPDSSGDPSPGSSSSKHYHRKVVLSISAIIAIGAAAFITLSVIAVTLLNIHVRSSMSRAPAAVPFSGGEDFSCSSRSDPNYGKLVMFSGDAESVAGAHALLNKDFEIGRGGFGVAYKTVLQNGRSVVIKKLAVSSLVKSQDEFERQVKKLGKVRHHNLVALEGYYWTPSLQLLINECIPGGSLYKQLHDGTQSSCLSWRQRFNLIVGMAKGIAHLHLMNIVHYNLKSTNVLIDEHGEAKVGDFGLARLLPALDRCILSSKIQSALGYMAPEFACRTVKITEKCDVYGFGVLVLEVVTGKRPVEYMEDDVVVLSDMVRRSLEDGRLEECVDASLQGDFPADETIPVVKLGLICASQVPSNRPDMQEIVKILELIQCPAEGQEQPE
ncbi:Leucine-rich repeat receptor-like protein kinase PXC2 [Linum grandiflorum]